MTEPKEIPWTVSTDMVKIVSDSFEAEGNSIIHSFRQSRDRVSKENHPSEIVKELEESDQKGRELAKFYVNLAQKIKAESDRIIAEKEKEHAPKLNELKNEKAKAEKNRDEGNNQDLNKASAAGIGILAILAAPATGGLSLLALGEAAVLGYGANEHDKQNKEAVDAIDGDISKIKRFLETLKQNIPNDLQSIGNRGMVHAFEPKIMAYRAAHGKNIYNELEKYAKDHGTTVDKIAEYLQRNTARAVLTSEPMDISNPNKHHEHNSKFNELSVGGGFIDQLKNPSLTTSYESYVAANSEDAQYEDAIDKTSKLIKEITDECEALKIKVNAHDIALPNLNKLLHNFLGRDDLTVEPNTTGYLIIRNGVQAENLSEGERTAIAFTYFIAKMQENEFDLSKGIIVIDDPISRALLQKLLILFSFIIFGRVSNVRFQMAALSG